MVAERAVTIAIGVPPGLRNAVAMWADATTDAGSARRRDLLRDKVGIVADFFIYAGKHPASCTPLDVKAWQAYLEGQGLAPATVYARISRVSSWYRWAMQEPELDVHHNPATLARPKAPKAYQGERTSSLTDDELQRLLLAVKARADAGDVVGKRDYALLMFFVSTGMRRREVIQLTWGNLKVNGTITLTGEVKGGDYVSREVKDPRVRDALLDYLATSGRLQWMKVDSPLWTRHDRAGAPGRPLSSHAFVQNLKRYAEACGVGDIHLHQTRHTFARLVGEEAGSLLDVQAELGHKNLATTRVYLQRVGVKKDRYSSRILDRLGV